MAPPDAGAPLLLWHSDSQRSAKIHNRRRASPIRDLARLASHAGVTPTSNAIPMAPPDVGVPVSSEHSNSQWRFRNHLLRNDSGHPSRPKNHLVQLHIAHLSNVSANPCQAPGNRVE
jgi:hypothetical protein